jgi:MFS transporter, DHA2 family, multidrug resistance protein
MFKDVHVYSGFSTNDIPKAQEFYSQTLGLEVTEEYDKLWLYLATGAEILLYPKEDHVPATSTMLNFQAALQPSSSQLLWIVDIYGFVQAGALITMGVLGDRIGRRKLLLIGAAVFGLTSILAAFARSAEMLIAARALLGLVAATLAPSTLSLIRNMFFDPKQP